MERTKKLEDLSKVELTKVVEEAALIDPILKWKKSSSGTFYMRGNRIIKPNEVFSARESEIPKGFRDVVVCLEPEKLSSSITGEAARFEVLKPVYEVKMRSIGWYDVVNEYGKPINEKPLRKADAEKLKTVLS